MSEITNAMRHLCEEKGLSYEVVLETLETALAAAYRKDFGSKNQNIKVKYNPETNDSDVFDVKTVVEDLTEEEKAEMNNENKEPQVQTPALPENQDEEKRRFNPKLHIQISDAKMFDEKIQLEDELKIELPKPQEYGRMAAQTAKQVIVQKLREAEKNNIIAELKEKEGEVINGVVQRYEPNFVLVEIGKAVGVLPKEEQIATERYNVGDKIKVYIKAVGDGPRGPEIILSRSSEEIVRRVFTTEIPEIANGLIEIKGVAREAGSRSKVAVEANGDNLDPIGSCVGQRGARIQTIIEELGGEKIDIITYSDNPVTYITNSLSPAKISDIQLDQENKKAIVIVSEDQQSLAIGKGGQNVRLAARLTGWDININSTSTNA